jgi:hypothetical protein
VETLIQLGEGVGMGFGLAVLVLAGCLGGCMAIPNSNDRGLQGLRWGTFTAVMAFYVAACFTPAIYVDDGISTSDLDFKEGSPIGLVILLFGWSGGNNGIPWSANIFLALGLPPLLLGRFRAAFVLGGIASALGLTTWPVWGYDRMLAGYYLWQASLLSLTTGAGYAAWRQSRLRTGEPARIAKPEFTPTNSAA